MDNKAEESKALHKALGYLSLRDRSIAEMIRYLKGKKYSEETIANIIDYLKSKDFLDDEAYAQKYCQYKINQLIGKNKIMVQLQAKGIQWDSINVALSQIYTDELEYDCCLSLAEKKFGKNLDKDNKVKLYRFLVSRGFTYQTVGKILNKLL